MGYLDEVPAVFANHELGECKRDCMVGECRPNMSDPYGCGGCCRCQSACFKACEETQTAPHIWEGDYA